MIMPCPKLFGVDSFIMRPVVETYNFVLKPMPVTFVERDQFNRHPLKNPNMHLRNFFAKYDTIKLNGVSTDTIRLRLFSISLRDRASDWLQNEEPNSFTR